MITRLNDNYIIIIESKLKCSRTKNQRHRQCEPMRGENNKKYIKKNRVVMITNYVKKNFVNR